jgi:hypothetical protein
LPDVAAAGRTQGGMDTLTLAVPAIGSRYTSHATGRPCHVSSVGATGTIGLTEGLYGPDWERRSYVTLADLAADYDPAP